MIHTIEIIIAILLIIVILLQTPTASLNLTTMGSGMTEPVKRGPAKILHITTVILGTLFIINSILLFLTS